MFAVVDALNGISVTASVAVPDGPLAALRRHRRLRCPRRSAACPRCCCARAAIGSCSTAARAPSTSCCARRAARARRDLHHPPAPGSLARPARDAQDVRPAAREWDADRLRAARPEGAVPTGAAPDHGPHGLPAADHRARAARRDRLRRLPDRRASRSSTASRPTATRSSRTTARAASTSKPRAGSASPRALTSAACSAARPSTASAGAGRGRGPHRPTDRLHG